MGIPKTYTRELECLSAADPLVQKSPKELCFIAFDELSPNRLSAIKKLQHYEGREVLRVLISLTDSLNPDVRQQAMESLAVKKGLVVTQLFEMWIQDDDPEVRRNILSVVEYASEEVRAVISIYTIDDKDAGVREMADEMFSNATRSGS